MHPANGLQLVSWVEDWFDQQHVSRFNDVQAVGAGVKRKKQNVDLLFVFERAQVLLEFYTIMNKLELHLVKLYQGL